jgi:hypothetical protein
VPELTDAGQAEAWQDALEQADFPERARSPEEQALAGLLVARGLADYQRALAAWDRARVKGCRVPAPGLPAVLLCQAVAAFGLDGLVGLAQAEEEVVAVAARGLGDGPMLDLGGSPRAAVVAAGDPGSRRSRSPRPRLR